MNIFRHDSRMASVTHNVIIFGEAGLGKSSIVNLIVGKDVAKVSSGAAGCTFESTPYETTIQTNQFRIYDTAGLNEGEQGRVPHWKSVQALYDLIWQLNGISLLVYCMRGRVKENSRANWLLFNKVICGEKVPIIAVVTGLEGEDDPDDWWRNQENKDTFARYQMKPKDVACVVSFRGKKNEHDEEYMKSQEKVRGLIVKHRLRRPWDEDKAKWFESIYAQAYTSGICFSKRDKLEYSSGMRNVLDEFVKETRMKGKDSKKLEVTLLKAEKKLRKRFG